MLEGKMIYLAEPVDFRPSDVPGLRSDELIEELRAAKAEVYSPRREWDEGRFDNLPAPTLLGHNMRKLDEADGVAVAWAHGAFSVGVPMEMYQAHLLGKPMVLMGDPMLARSKIIQGMAIPVAFNPQDAVRALDSIIYQGGAQQEPKDLHNQYQWSGPEHLQPRRKHAEDAGWDMIVEATTHVPPRQMAEIPCGIRIAPPEGMWTMVVGRSSTFKRGLITNVGVIDGGYRGRMHAAVFNASTQTQIVEAGTRIAQLIPMDLQAPHIKWHHTNALPNSDRGENGYGSTGA